MDGPPAIGGAPAISLRATRPFVTVDTAAVSGNIQPMHDFAPPDPSEKSRGVATALAALLGPFGAHRFYVGKIGTGLLQLITLGGFGIWWIVDHVLITWGSFTDKQQNRLTQWT